MTLMIMRDIPAVTHAAVLGVHTAGVHNGPDVLCKPACQHAVPLVQDKASVPGEGRLRVEQEGQGEV